MKRQLHAVTAVADNRIAQIAMETFGSSNPGTGCHFIAKDGTFVNIYPKIDVHEDLCEWVEDQLGIELDYRDEEYFIREFGWIRLRSDPNMSIIELPNAKPTSSQWYALEDWLDYLEEKYIGRGCTLYLSVCDFRGDVDVPYAFGTEYFSEDIMKVLKKYYSTGRLYASTSIKASTESTRTQKLVNRIIEEIKLWLEDAYIDDDTIFYNWGELLEACDLTSSEARSMIIEALEGDIWDAIMNHRKADHSLQFDDDGEFEDENGNFLKYGQVMRIVKKELVNLGILEKAS